MPNRVAAALFLSQLCAVALAQPAIVTVDALTAQGVLVGDGAQTWTTSVPAGALPATGAVGGGQVLQGAPRNAEVSWRSTVEQAGVAFSLAHFVSAGPGGSFSYGEMGQAELLVTIAGTGGPPVPWRLEGGLVLGSSMPTVLLEVDVGNDGTIDWTPTTFGTIGAFGADLTAQPLVVRIVYRITQTLASAAALTLELDVVPADVDTFRIASNCYSPNTYAAEPLLFSAADVLLSSSGGPGTTWQVIGFATTPVVLPLALTSTPVPCLLLPTPAWVVQSPNVFLSVPASVRPLSFYSQALELGGGSLRSSDTFLVTAR